MKGLWRSGVMIAGEMRQIPTLARLTRDTSRWPTPRATDGSKNVRSLEGAIKEVARKGITGVDLHAAVLARGGEEGPLNPEWVEWLRGYPAHWTHLKDPA